MDPDLARARAGRRPVARILAAAGMTAPSPATTTLEDAAVGADAVLMQLRVGGQAARPETRRGPWSAAASARRRQGQVASRKRCAPSPSCSTSPTRFASEPRRLDRELHQPRRHRHPCTAGCRAPCCRTVQRRDRIPAPLRRELGVSPGGGLARACRAEPPELGAGCSGASCGRHGDGGPRPPPRRAWRGHRRRDRAAPRPPSSNRALIPSYYLRYYLEHARSSSNARDRAVARGGGSRDRESEPLALYADPNSPRSPRSWLSAAARTTPKPRSACSPASWARGLSATTS